MADWTLGTGADTHLDEHNLFDHDGIASPTAGKVLGVSGGKYTQVDAGTGDHDQLTNVSSDDHHTEDHQARHQAGGADALTGNLNATARTSVRRNSTLIAARRQINFIEGSNITLSVVDDAPNEEVDVTITASGGSSGGLSLYKKTSSWTVTGPGVYIVDTSSSNVTATLPLVSATGATGMRLVFKRLGSNYLYVTCQGSDHFDLGTTTQKTLWNDDNALSIAAMASVANTWMEFGYFGAVT